MGKLLTGREQLLLAGVAFAVLVGAASMYFAGPSEQTTAPSPSVAETSVSASAVAATSEEPPLPVEEPPLASAGSNSAQQDTQEPPAEKLITVSLRGAVQTPGVYEVAAGARVQELIDRAGGPIETANLDDINLVAPLRDGSTLTIPHGQRRELVEGELILRGAEHAALLNPGYYTISRYPGSDRRVSNSPSREASPEVRQAKSGGVLNLNYATEAELETLPGIGPKRAAQIVAYRDEKPFQTVEELTEISGIGPKTLEAVRDLVTVDPN